MSHFTKLNLEIKNIQALKSASIAMGLPFKENAKARGWQGDKMKANYVIEGSGRYDIAVVKKGESYDLVADWSMADKGLINKVGKNGQLLIQNYGVACAAEIAKEQNMEVEYETLEDGTIRLILTEDEYVNQY